MEKQNFEETLKNLKMDQTKAYADSIQKGWDGLGHEKKATAGSYLDGIKKAVLNESNSNPVPQKKGFYDLGLNNTLLALRNTPLYELPDARIMLEKYLNDLNIKGVAEVYLFESFMRDLSNFTWEQNAKAALDNMSKIYESNVREIMVLKTIADLRNSGGRQLFSGLGETLTEWLMSPVRSSETLMLEMKKWNFAPAIKHLVHNISLIESKKPSSLNIISTNSNCDVKNLVAPSMVKENYSIHAINGRFIKISKDSLNVMEKEEVAKLPGKFLNAVLALNSENVKVNENGVDFLVGRSKFSVVFEGNQKKVYLNGKQMPLENLGTALSLEFRNYFGNSAPIVEKAMSIVKYADQLADLDFAKSIKSKVYEGVEVNLFKVGKKIYVQRVNPSMKKNEMFEANGNQTVNLVKEFIGFDISESLTTFLDGENRIKSIMYNDRKAISDNMKMIENELAKIENVTKSNPLIANTPQILEAKAMLTNESEILKSRWNEINVEIERFEKGSKKIELNETGYGIDTPIKIKRNGVKGTIIGVNTNSKTYTIMTEKGGTGEYFFSDVIDASDEIDGVDINHVKEGKEIEDLKNMQLADLPGKDKEKVVNKPSMTSAGSFGSDKISGKDKFTGGKGGAKFIENEKNMGLAGLKFKEAPGYTEGPTGVSGKSNMATLPKDKSSKMKDVKGVSGKSDMSGTMGGNAKGGVKFIEKESDMKLAGLPKEGKKSGSKDIENEKNMNLATLPGEKKKVVNNPSGTSAGVIKSKKIMEAKKQENSTYSVAPGKKAPTGKKFIEKQSDSAMVKTPGNANHNGKKFHEDLKNAGLAAAPGMKGKTKGNSLKMLNGKVKRSK